MHSKPHLKPNKIRFTLPSYGVLYLIALFYISFSKPPPSITQKKRPPIVSTENGAIVLIHSNNNVNWQNIERKRSPICKAD